MANITIKVDDEVADWARIWAAKHRSSVSRMLGKMLRERMDREQGYEAASKEWSSYEPRPLREPGEPLPSRDEIHER